MGTDIKNETLANMDAAADDARLQLTELVMKYPEAAEAFGKWAKANYLAAGYKRLGQVMVALG